VRFCDGRVLEPAAGQNQDGRMAIPNVLIAISQPLNSLYRRAFPFRAGVRHLTVRMTSNRAEFVVLSVNRGVQRLMRSYRARPCVTADNRTLSLGFESRVTRKQALLTAGNGRKLKPSCEFARVQLESIRAQISSRWVAPCRTANAKVSFVQAQSKRY
jgi:hypothetical protein